MTKGQQIERLEPICAWPGSGKGLDLAPIVWWWKDRTVTPEDDGREI
jgi:hypothetical protein